MLPKRPNIHRRVAQISRRRTALTTYDRDSVFSASYQKSPRHSHTATSVGSDIRPQTVNTMRKLPAYLLAILVGGIIWFFFSHFELVPKPEGAEPQKKLALGGVFDFLKVSNRDEPDATHKGVDPNAIPTTPQPTQSDAVAQSTGVQAPIGSSIHDASTHSHTTDSINASAPLGTLANDAGPLRPAAEIPMRSTDQQQSLTDRPNTIRIGSFHLHYFGSSASDERGIEILAHVVRKFDIIALQGIAPGGRAAVIELARKAGGYDVLLAAQRVVQLQDEQFAYLYNRKTIVADHGDGLYTLGDERQKLRRDPLIGWFRAKQAREDQAFTFSLVNINTSARYRQQELDILDEAMFAIQDDGRLEDDVILLGNFRAPHNQLGQLGRLNGMVKAITTPTADLQVANTQNIVFLSNVTDEYAARAGVFDYRSHFNLDTGTAQGISDYLPIWAEFSVYETGQPRRTSY